MTQQDQQRRQSYLEWLYARAGRTDGLYTSLFQDRLRELLDADMKEALGLEGGP